MMFGARAPVLEPTAGNWEGQANVSPESANLLSLGTTGGGGTPATCQAISPGICEMTVYFVALPYQSGGKCMTCRDFSAVWVVSQFISNRKASSNCLHKGHNDLLSQRRVVMLGHQREEEASGQPGSRNESRLWLHLLTLKGHPALLDILLWKFMSLVQGGK